jgi:PEP-CTERM motif
MRLVSTIIGLAILSGLCLCREARAGLYVFDTESTATQMISSPLLGTFPLDASGTQQFTINTTTGFANVTSSFQGSDLPDPFTGQNDTYNLYNTATTGSVTMNPSGSYNISFQLLFELDVTSGALNGLSLVTMENATFENVNVTALPFPVPIAFSDTSGGSDSVGVYLKNDFGNYTAGTQAGVSYDRIVTVNSIVPEPSGIALLGLGVVGLCLHVRKARAN